MPELTTNFGLQGSEWLTSVGWLPPRGAAPGFIADLFVEFSWGAVLGCLLLGRLYRYLWRKGMAFGDYWFVIYVSLMVVSVFMVAQTFEAWAHRFLVMAVPSIMAWKLAALRLQSGSPPRNCDRAFAGVGQADARVRSRERGRCYRPLPGSIEGER